MRIVPGVLIFALLSVTSGPVQAFGLSDCVPLSEPLAEESVIEHLYGGSPDGSGPITSNDYIGWFDSDKNYARGHIAPYFISGGDRDGDGKDAEFEHNLKVEEGIDLETIRRLGGWRSLDMVTRYAAVSTEHMDAAVAKLR